jgi:predicted dehydrogenase
MLNAYMPGWRRAPGGYARDKALREQPPCRVGGAAGRIGMSEQKHTGLSRREFGMTAAAAGFAILSSRAAMAAPSATDTIKVGLIGCGGRGFGAAMNCLESHAHVQIVALADAFEHRVEEVKRKLNRSAKTDAFKNKIALEDDHCFFGLDAYKKLLATDVDMIIHATPPYARPEHIEAAVEAGKHIFTEKPIAVDPVGVRRFMAAAEKAAEKKLCLVAGTQRRHQKEYVETIEKIHAGEIGDVLSMRCYWNGNLPFSHERKEGEKDLEYRLRNWYNQVWTCGEGIVEQHIHNVDVCNWVMNTHPVKVVASGGRAWKPNTERYGDIWDNMSCDFEYANGVHLYSFCRHWNDSKNDVFEEVTGTKGKSKCMDLGVPGIDPYVQEHIDLQKAIRGEAPYVNEGIRVAESTMTCIMGRMSAFTGQEYTWEQALNEDLSIVPANLDWDAAYPLGAIAVPGGKKA